MGGCVNCCNRNKNKVDYDDDDVDESGFLVPYMILRVSLVDSVGADERLISMAVSPSTGMASFRTCDPRRDYDFVLRESDLAAGSTRTLSLFSGLLFRRTEEERKSRNGSLPLADLKQFESATKQFQMSAESWIKLQLTVLPSHTLAMSRPKPMPRAGAKKALKPAAPEAVLSIIVHQVKAKRPIVLPLMRLAIAVSETNCLTYLLRSESDPSTTTWVPDYFGRRMLLAVESVGNAKLKLWLVRGDWSETSVIDSVGVAVVAVSDLVDVSNHKIKLEESASRYDEEGNSFEVVISTKLF